MANNSCPFDIAIESHLDSREMHLAKCV